MIPARATIKTKVVRGKTSASIIRRKSRKDIDKECKQHRWRCGAKTGRVIITKGEIIPEYTYIWCERCDKTLKAYHHAKFNSPFLNKLPREKDEKI